MTVLRKSVRRELLTAGWLQNCIQVSSASARSIRGPPGTSHGRAFTGKQPKFRRASTGLSGLATGTTPLTSKTTGLNPAPMG